MLVTRCPRCPRCPLEFIRTIFLHIFIFLTCDLHDRFVSILFDQVGNH
jgi:hypothetical protein